MKITKKELEIIVQEEVEAALNEFDVIDKGIRGAKIIGKTALDLGRKAAKGAYKIGSTVTSPVSDAIGGAVSKQQYKKHFSQTFQGNSREARSQALSYFARYINNVDDYEEIIDILVDHFIKAGKPTKEAKQLKKPKTI